MRPEIEAKFLATEHREIRKRLESQKAELVTPMRLTKKVILDYPNRRLEHNKEGWLRISDDGDRVTLTYKETVERQRGYSREIEVVTSDFEKTVELFKKVGLKIYALQESRREVWRLGSVDIMLDEWPWLKSFTKVEGLSEAAVRDAAARIGLPWSQAVFGSLNIAYAAEYPGIKLSTKENISQIPEMLFGKPLPAWLKERITP